MPGRPLRAHVPGGQALLGLALLAASACGPEVPEVTVVQPAPPGPGVVYTPVEVTLTPANVAAVVIAANQAEIDRANVARVRAASPEVRAFAERVLRESQAASRTIQQALMAYDIQPQPEAMASQIQSNAATTIAQMNQAQGFQVDRIYLDSEIASHRWQIGVLDAVIPSLQRSGAQQELTSLRNALAGRLAEAERISANLRNNRTY